MLKFSLKFSFAGQDQEVFGSKNLLTFTQDGIVHKGFVLVGAEDDAQRGVVVLAAFEVVEHPHIHVHLPNVSMAEFVRLQVDEDKALEEIVVEDQIDVEVGGLGANAKLAAHEREAFAKFHEKVAQAGDEGIFELAFAVRSALRQV